ncbi:MAG: four helix bundle protein [Bacteroidales bacterium]|nr:four helix bundle protein [Bacteroidales bacterium]
MKLEELQVYQLSMDIGEKVWNIVAMWDFFSKDTIGKQLVRSIDLVAANLSEGYGRFHYKEKRISRIIPEVPYLNQKHGLQKHLIEN